MSVETCHGCTLYNWQTDTYEDCIVMRSGPSDNLHSPKVGNDGANPEARVIRLRIVSHCRRLRIDACRVGTRYIPCGIDLVLSLFHDARARFGEW
jgi:hypothetical protein